MMSSNSNITIGEGEMEEKGVVLVSGGDVKEEDIKGWWSKNVEEGRGPEDKS
ncbi:hypothetical protein LINPERPRIM_LOCUS29919 [Linum perenne]